jgi:hypothetical protein
MSVGEMKLTINQTKKIYVIYISGSCIKVWGEMMMWGEM